MTLFCDRLKELVLRFLFILTFSNLVTLEQQVEVDTVHAYSESFWHHVSKAFL